MDHGEPVRIRSIRPEFWSSEDVAAMSWETRLVYIGLWSYVDDNGVGRDSEKLVTAALFALDDDLPESSRRVTGALAHLSKHGQITRYVVAGKRYLHISAWSTHQRIEKASKGRYPLPTCEDAGIAEPSGRIPVGLPDMSTPGEGEKGRSVEGEKLQTPPTAVVALIEAPSVDDEFADWYAVYPRHVGRGQALKAYRAARKKVSADVLLGAIQQQAAFLAAKGSEFCPHPSTWLNGERWADEAPRQVAFKSKHQQETDAVFARSAQHLAIGGPQ